MTTFEPGEEGLAMRADFAREAAEHDEIHRDRSARFRRLGFLPAFKRDRDRMLAEGTLMLGSPDAAAQEVGAEKVIDSAFAWSLSSRFDDDSILEHPSRSEFARQLDLEAHFGEQIGTRLRARYGQWSGRYIDTWSMQWGG